MNSTTNTPSTGPLAPPPTDPTPIFEFFRGSYATELLTVAVAHLPVFEILADGPMPERQLQARLSLADRPTVVLLTALRSMGLVETTPDGHCRLTRIAQNHLVPGAEFDITGYIGLASQSPNVLAMAQRLRTNRPDGMLEGSDQKAAFIYRAEIESAMDEEASARRLTLSLAGRAKNVAPLLASRLSFPSQATLLDVGGGSGIYSIALVRRHSGLRAIVWDRPEVLKVAQEMAESYGVADRIECLPGDMFTDPVPHADAILLSNILHDWDVPECRALVGRLADSLAAGGQILIHDVFLNDALDGPLPVALYSAALFSLTLGRAYSAVEYRQWLSEAGMEPGEITSTLVHCGILPATKR